MNEDMFLNEFVKINFSLTEKNNLPISFLSTKIVYKNNCSQECVHGVCINESCQCQNGYMGEDCSIGKIKFIK